MTARAQLESEREALTDLRSHFEAPSTWHAALTASIARVEALLSLSDEQCGDAVYSISEAADTLHTERRYMHHTAERRVLHEAHEAALRTVAEIVRRS